jgi:hypothetical protein
MVRLATQALFAKEVAMSQDAKYGTAAAVGNSGKFHQAFLDVVDLTTRSALRKDDLIRLVFHNLFGAQKAQERIRVGDGL